MSKDAPATQRFTTHDGRKAIRHLEDDPELGIARGSEVAIDERAVYAIEATHPDGSTRWITSGDTYPKSAVPYYNFADATATAERLTSLVGHTSPIGTVFSVHPHPDPKNGRA